MALGCRRRGMDVQFAKQPSERLVLIPIHFLVAEEDHLMLHQRIVYLREHLISRRSRQVDTGDFRTDDGTQWFNGNGFIGHGSFSPIARLEQKR